MRFVKNNLIIVTAAIVLAGCAIQPMPIANDAPGFWHGLLHGAISPFALIVGLFTDTRVYAFPNSGWWYDFGFLLGIGALTAGALPRYRADRRQIVS
jgi:hypothetical protein